MSQRSERWIVACLAVAAVIARLIPGPRVIDDAFITFRYAQNLLAGNGLVYNPGELVLGTTTPLYALILTILAAPFGAAQAPFPEIAWIFNAAMDGVTCVLLFKLGRMLGSELGGLAAGTLWVVAPYSVTFSIGGMETSLTILLIVAALYLHLRRSQVAAALAGALALLARPDALLFIAPLAVERLRQLWIQRGDWRRSIPEVAAFALPPIAWAAFATITYGSPFTQSVAAKVAAYQLAPDAAFIRMLQHYATPFLGHKTFGLGWIAVGLVLFPILFGLGALFGIRQDQRSWPMFVAPWLYFLAFSIANPLIFRWYLAPPLPFFMLGIFLGIQRIASDLNRQAVLAVLGGVAILLTVRGWVLHPGHGPDRPAPEMAYIELELLYQRAAEGLHHDLRPSDRLAAADIGALGYYTGAYIVDTLGLITPAATAYYPAPAEDYEINYTIPTELIHDLEPDHIVILEVYGRRTLLMDPAFARDYQLVETLPTDIYTSRGMLVFTRWDRP